MSPINTKGRPRPSRKASAHKSLIADAVATGVTGLSSLDPVIVGKRAKAVAYSVLTQYSANRSACRRMAEEIAEHIRSGWVATAKASLGIDAQATIDWSQVSVSYSMKHGGNGDGNHGRHNETQGIAHTTRVPHARTTPENGAEDDTIGRRKVMDLLRSLLLRANEGQVAIGDGIRLAEAVAKLEGLHTEAKAGLNVYLIQYDDPSLPELEASAEVP